MSHMSMALALSAHNLRVYTFSAFWRKLGHAQQVPSIGWHTSVT